MRKDLATMVQDLEPRQAFDRPRAGALRGTGSMALQPVQPRTMVEQAAETILAAAARGAFLPGDRLVEADIARALNISRVPVREALRLLESQGVVVSMPYRGMRLMEINNQIARDLLIVRLALERLAVQLVRAKPGYSPSVWQALQPSLDALKQANLSGDGSAITVADVAFHGEIVRLSGNDTLYLQWKTLAGKLAVLFGLVIGAGQTKTKGAPRHEKLIQLLSGKDDKAIDTELETHLLGWWANQDFEAAIEQKRRARLSAR